MRRLNLLTAEVGNRQSYVEIEHMHFEDDYYSDVY